MNTIFFNEKNGLLRSGWRAALFLFAYVFVTVSIGGVVQAILLTAHIDTSMGTGAYLIVSAAFSLAPAILIGWLCGKYLEKLPFKALGVSFSSGWLKHCLLGLVIGAVTLSFAVMIGIGFGGLRFVINEAPHIELLKSLVMSFAIFGVAAAFEEAFFRGYLLQTFARSGFAWLAILLTSVFFGAVHMGNPNASVFSTANTMLAGIWFSIAYLKTRDLWFVWGLHLMWNWMQGSFFGIEVSGLIEITPVSLLKEIDKGPMWLTGETYGMEGGIACTIAIALSIGIIYLLPGLKADSELSAMNTPT